MEDEALISELLEVIRKNISDVALTENRDNRTFSFKLKDASMNGIASGAVKLKIKCDAAPSSKPKPKTPPKQQEQPAITTNTTWTTKEESASKRRGSVEYKIKPKPKSEPDPVIKPQPAPPSINVESGSSEETDDDEYKIYEPKTPTTDAPTEPKQKEEESAKPSKPAEAIKTPETAASDDQDEVIFFGGSEEDDDGDNDNDGDDDAKSKPDSPKKDKPKSPTKSKPDSPAKKKKGGKKKKGFVPPTIATDSSPLAPAKSLVTTPVKSRGKKTKKTGAKVAALPEDAQKVPASPHTPQAGVTNASKVLYGTVKNAREHRTHLATKSTFDGCEYIPNLKGSERGLVLKKSNAELQEKGIVKKSQIVKVNEVDISDQPLKKIKKLLADKAALDRPYSVQFTIPSLELSTQEITFNGYFCPNVEFTKEYNGNNYIIKSIPDIEDNKYLLHKAELKPGYRLYKVQGKPVLNKPFADTQKMLNKAGTDKRVKYQVIFIEGKLSWYNFRNPNGGKNHKGDDDEKKDQKPKLKKKKSSQRKAPKSPRNAPKSPRNARPTTPRTPGGSAFGKNAKYFLKDKKNEKVYFDMRIDGDKRGRIEIILFAGICPKTCKNFLKLCTGDNKNKLTYKGKKFYKMYVGMGLEGGDVENNDGSGKKSIYGGYFDDENFTIRHSQYCLSMKNEDKPNTNASQFYIITADDAEFLDGKNVVFGYIADKDSQSLVDDMEEEGCSLTGKPKVKAVISKCGKLKK